MPLVYFYRFIIFSFFVHVCVRAHACMYVCASARVPRACVCVCMCVSMHVCLYVHVHVCMWKPEVGSRRFPLLLPTSVFEQLPLIGPNDHHFESLGWSAYLGDPSVSALRSWDFRPVMPPMTFMGMWGTLPQVLMFVQQIIGPLRQIAISVISVARRTRLVQCELLHSVVEETGVELLGLDNPVEHLDQLLSIKIWFNLFICEMGARNNTIKTCFFYIYIENPCYCYST